MQLLLPVYEEKEQAQGRAGTTTRHLLFTQPRAVQRRLVDQTCGAEQKALGLPLPPQDKGGWFQQTVTSSAINHGVILPIKGDLLKNALYP